MKGSKNNRFLGSGLLKVFVLDRLSKQHHKNLISFATVLLISRSKLRTSLENERNELCTVKSSKLNKLKTKFAEMVATKNSQQEHDEF